MSMNTNETTWEQDWRNPEAWENIEFIQIDLSITDLLFGNLITKILSWLKI